MSNAPLNITEKNRNIREVDTCLFIIVSNHSAVCFYIYIYVIVQFIYIYIYIW